MVAGLLGITVIGAVLSSRESSALRHGVAPVQAFLDGYHAGLAVTIALTAAGIVAALLALLRITGPRAPVPAEVAAPGGAGAPRAALEEAR